MPDRAATPHQLSTLLELLSLGADRAFVHLTSSELGLRLGITQQAASVRLAAVERAGLAERRHEGRGLGVRLTEKGSEVVQRQYRELSVALGGVVRDRGPLKFVGTVFKGMGEGGYYISRPGYKAQFQEKLGFKPFPGTLNLRLSGETQEDQRRQLQLLSGILVEGFTEGGRTYGPVKCFRAEIGKEKGAALAIERTHYDYTVLEVIAPVNLRRSLGLADGSKCEVVVYAD